MNEVTIQEFITLADELIQDQSSSIKIRAAASRAYYGAYHAANIFHASLSSKGVVVSSGGVGVHEQLIQRLENPTLPYSDPLFNKSKSLGFILRRVRKSRNEADYEISASISIEDMRTAISEAKKVVLKSQPAII